MTLITVDTIEEKEESVSVPGGELYVKQWVPEGTTSRIPVILFHDSIGCVEMWRHFPRSLASWLKAPVIAYDRLGFGRSSARTTLPSVRFVTEEAEIYVPALVKSLGVDQFIALGHSVGGAMAVITAARFGEHCRAVITEAAQAFVEEQTIQSIASAKLKFRDSGELAKLQRYHGSKARWVVDAWTDTWLNPRFRDWSLELDLPAVRSPLLAIHGDADEYGSIEFPKTLSSKTGGPAQMLILEACGHVPHREHEEEVLDAIENFLSASAYAGRSHRV